MKKSLASLSFLFLAAPIFWPTMPQQSDDLASVHINRTQSASSVADVVTAANAFIATLSVSQQSTLVVPYTQTNVKKWSNLPCGLGCREGLQLGNLTVAQQAAAQAVIQAAMGTTANEGFDEANQIRAADDYLAANGGGNGYSSGIYFIAFAGTPSTTGTWQLQFGGHHLAVNTTYEGGAVTGATPSFRGVEPKSWTTGGMTYAPLGSEQSTMAAMLAGLTTAQLNTAHLSQRFSDVLLGPNQDGNFPTTKVGQPVSALDASQKALVMAAMEPWVKDADDSTAAHLLAAYQSELDQTYIAYSGNASLNANADYVRIDGPTVWIEFVCQSGVVFRNQIHYHSIWRDHGRDYGGNFYVTGLKADVEATSVFSVLPNPAMAGKNLIVKLAKETSAATYTLRNSLGQTVASKSFAGSGAEVPTAGLAPGTYVLSLEAAGQKPMAQRVVIR